MLTQGAQGLILDLRDNPGGLLTQAIGVASIFIPTARSSPPADATSRRRCTPPLGDAIAPKIPLVVLVDRGTASSAEIVTGALKDHGRAKVIGTHTYGKGVFQEIQPVPGGGALDITVGEYFTPNGQNLGGGGVKRGQGRSRPNIYVYDNPQRPGLARPCSVAEQTVAGEIEVGGGRRARAARRRPARRRRPAWRWSSGAASSSSPSRSSARAAARGEPRPRYDVGDLVLVTPGVVRAAGRAARGAKVARRLGKPDVARDVIEALMLDRGPGARLRAAGRAGGAEAASELPIASRSWPARRDLRELPTFTIDPTTARDFDDAISASEADGGGWRCGSTSPTSART